MRLLLERTPCRQAGREQSSTSGRWGSPRRPVRTGRFLSPCL
jgi:hypothetical protein